MLKKYITYTDYDGKERNELFYFNLNKAELMDMELETTGGMRRLLELIIEKQDIPKIVQSFKTLILKAYGEKSADGRRFIKSEELSRAFQQTEAYSNLYMELMSNADEAAKFINGIVPADIAAMAEKQKEKEANKAEDEVAHLLDDK